MRYAISIAIRFGGDPYTYCGRTRCDVTIPVTPTEDRKWRLDRSAVVVSTEDGDRIQYFCSVKCTKLALR